MLCSLRLSRSFKLFFTITRILQVNPFFSYPNDSPCWWTSLRQQQTQWSSFDFSQAVLWSDLQLGTAGEPIRIILPCWFLDPAWDNNKRVPTWGRGAVGSKTHVDSVTCHCLSKHTPIRKCCQRHVLSSILWTPALSICSSYIPNSHIKALRFWKPRAGCLYKHFPTMLYLTITSHRAAAPWVSSYPWWSLKDCLFSLYNSQENVPTCTILEKSWLSHLDSLQNIPFHVPIQVSGSAAMRPRLQQHKARKGPVDSVHCDFFLNFFFFLHCDFFIRGSRGKGKHILLIVSFWNFHYASYFTSASLLVYSFSHSYIFLLTHFSPYCLYTLAKYFKQYENYNVVIFCFQVSDYNE